MNVHTKIKRFSCPCCGGDMGEATDLQYIREVVTQPSQRLIFDMLAKVPGKAVSRDEIFDRLYSHRSDGGPDKDGTAVHVFISQLRKKLETVGWTVSRPRLGRLSNGEYRLIPTEAGA